MKAAKRCKNKAHGLSRGRKVDNHPSPVGGERIVAGLVMASPEPYLRLAFLAIFFGGMGYSPSSS